MAALKRRRQSIGDRAFEAAKNVERKVEHVLTCMFHELPAWMQDNHFILRGYRPESLSFRKSAASLLYFHNETVNIYTHLVGAVYLLLTSIYLHHTIAPRYPSSTKTDIAVFGAYFMGAGMCLALSATYHTISNHSLPIAKFGNQLDYLGIVLCIFGSTVPSIYYGFRCHPHLMHWYWSFMGVIGLAVSVVTMKPSFRTPKWRPFRAAMFVGMGVSAVVPIIHGMQLYTLQELDERIGLRWTALQGVLYIMGAGIYAGRMPERWWPGTFDLVGSSHQIFHVFVVAAASSHLVGLVKAFDYLHSRGGDVC